MAMTITQPTLLDLESLQNTHAHEHNPVVDAVLKHLMSIAGEEVEPTIQTFSSEGENELVTVNVLTAPMGEDEVLVATFGNGVTPNKANVKFTTEDSKTTDLPMGQELFTVVAAGEEEAVSHALAGLVFFQDTTGEPLRPGMTLGGQAVEGTNLTHALIAERVLTNGATVTAPAPIILKDELFIAFMAVTLLTEKEASTGGEQAFVDFLAAQSSSIHRPEWVPAENPAVEEATEV